MKVGLDELELIDRHLPRLVAEADSMRGYPDDEAAADEIGRAVAAIEELVRRHRRGLLDKAGRRDRGAKG